MTVAAKFGSGFGQKFLIVISRQLIFINYLEDMPAVFLKPSCRLIK